MRKIKRFRLFLFLFLVFCIAGSLPVGASSGSSKKDIRIGYTKFDQMIRQDREGNFYGYGVDLLNRIADYTEWQYEFVPIEEAERDTKLLNGDVDIICNFYQRDNSNKQLCFSKENSGIEYAVLCTGQDNNQIFYEDYKAMQGIKIGINTNSNMDVLLTRWGLRYSVKFERVYYESFEVMHQALEEGEIAAMVTSNLRELSDMKYLAKVGIQDDYFASTQKKYYLMDTLEAALDQIKLEDPFYTAKLYEKYYGSPSRQLTGITKEEYQFMTSGQILKVAYDANSCPVEYYDTDTGSYEGVYADAVKKIEEKSGLQFEYIPVQKYEDVFKMIQNGEVDLVSGAAFNTKSQKTYEMEFTESYLAAEYAMICKKGKETADNFHLALPKGYLGIQNYFRENYPKWTISEYDSIEKCLSAVETDQADATAVDTIFMQTVYNINNYDDFVIIPTKSVSIPICMGIGKNNTKLLKSILTKAIYQIPEEEFDKCVVENAVNISYIPKVEELVKKFLPHILSVVLAMVLIGFMFLKNREQRFRHMAMTDPVTGLWNGIKFREEGDNLLNRNKQKSYTIISLDIDRFKFINNDFGQKSADNVLFLIGERIRKTFGEDALYARDMADMFLILTEREENLEARLDAICGELFFDNMGKEQPYKPVIKYGICQIEPREQEESIISYIDRTTSARKTVKGLSGCRIAYYDSFMQETIAYEQSIEKNMESALKNREFVVYYQPKYDLHSEQIIGGEALVRWISPEYGMIHPDRFIPIFEKNGFVLQLDFYVYEEVLNNMAKWKKDGKTNICISVNVSRVHIGTADFLPRLIALADQYGIEHRWLELELTETILGSKKESVVSFIVACKEAGFHISIDDFGSGYSSLNLLKELPVDILKIDKEFLDEVEDSVRSSIIVEQVVEMARKIKIGTLCEGVETKRQEDFLKQIGCDMAQGYLYSRPIPKTEFEEMF